VKRISLVSAAFGIGYAAVMATGLLTMTFGVLALINHTSFVEYYEYIFPRFRGGAQSEHIPWWGYVTFVVYTGVAATIAADARRRFEKWLNA
jgi:hypothetical protein